jgi:ankyrin repeat protein
MSVVNADRFLELVGAGETAAVRAALETAPDLVNAVGAHPFWGGRPQALHLAVEANRRDMFDLLLARGADVNGTNDGYDHWSPLMLAIQRGHTEMRDALIRQGARIGLLESLMLGNDDEVDAWLGRGPLPALSPNGGSVLAFARTTHAIDRLLELGASTTQKDRWGSAPIDALSRLGGQGRPLVAHLMARGVEAAPQEYARLGDLPKLQALAERQPGVVLDDLVMMGAVDFGHRDIVTWLLSQGASANARSAAQSRHTALHSAAWNGDVDMIRLLLHAGADRSLRDEQYDATAEGWAETSIQVTNNPRCLEVLSVLRARG